MVEAPVNTKECILLAEIVTGAVTDVCTIPATAAVGTPAVVWVAEVRLLISFPVTTLEPFITAIPISVVP